MSYVREISEAHQVRNNLPEDTYKVLCDLKSKLNNPNQKEKWTQQSQKQK